MRTLTFAAGVAAGYVLGTRAGREKYEQIVEAARGFVGQPAVVSAQAKIKEAVSAGTDAVTSKLTSVSDDVIDSTRSARPAPKKTTAASM